jgi:type I restriction enzyme, S subunit
MKNGWQTKKLGDLCSFENGDRGENYPSKSVQTTSGVPFINAGHLSESGIDFSDMNYIPRERFELLGNGKIRKDDILFCLRGSLGKFASVGDLSEGAIASSLVIIRPSDAILNEFVLAYLQSDLCAEMIKEFRNGAAQPNLAAASLKKFSIPVPPLPEQQRIVGILDEAFENIATAKANTRENLQNVRTLFDSHLQAVFNHRSEGWVERPLGDLVTFRNGINFTRSSRGEVIKIVGVKDFQKSFWAPLDNLDTVTTDGVLSDSDMLKENDLLFVRSNGNMELIGRCLLVGKIADRVTHSGFTIRARLSGSSVTPRYLCRFLKSNSARRKLVDSGIGTNIKSLNQMTLSTLLVPFPSGAEQTRLVEQLETFEVETQRLASLYERKLAELEALKKALLHEAFSGEL